MKALTALDLYNGAGRPCLNPASVIWPVWPSEKLRYVTQKTARTREIERPIAILNSDWTRKELFDK